MRYVFFKKDSIVTSRRPSRGIVSIQRCYLRQHCLQECSGLQKRSGVEAAGLLQLPASVRLGWQECCFLPWHSLAEEFPLSICRKLLQTCRSLCHSRFLITLNVRHSPLQSNISGRDRDLLHWHFVFYLLNGPLVYIVSLTCFLNDFFQFYVCSFTSCMYFMFCSGG